MEKEHKYTSDEKLQHLGYGEWVEEPDYAEFSYKGYECCVTRNLQEEPYAPGNYFGGFLCGYVTVPEDHPVYMKPFDEINVDCHGDLTFSGYSKENNKKHCIGFDCAHSGDYNPSIELFRKKNGLDRGSIFPIPEQFKKLSIFNPVYRNMEYCIKECKSIVRQLIKMKQEQKAEVKE